MKIVRIIARLNIGGPAIHATFLHQKLYPEFDTVLATGRLDTDEGDMSYLLESERGVVWVSTMSRPVRLASDFATLVRIWQLLRRERPDIVHTHTAKAGTVGRLAALMAGVPVIVHTYHGHIFRGGYFGRTITRIFLYIERVLNRFTTQIVTVSESQATELAEEFKVAPRNRIAVIPNGYDLSRFPALAAGTSLRQQWGVNSDETLVVWAGRMVPVKNVDMLADIVRCASSRKKIKFVIIGGGAELPRLEALLAGCSNVRFVGWFKDMAAAWTAADIALLTSRNEGTPSSLIEAMAAEKPLVTTSAGGVRDLLIGPGGPEEPDLIRYANGFAFTSAESALRALDRLAEDLGLRTSMGNRGRDFALRTYSGERLIDDMRALYYRLSGKPANDVTSHSAFSKSV